MCQHICISASRPFMYLGVTILQQMRYHEMTFLTFCRRCLMQTGSPRTFPSAGGSRGDGTARLDLLSLGPVVQHLLQAGLAPSAQRTYMAGKRKYLAFCQNYRTPPLPVTEQKLVNFIAHMSTQGLKYQTMKCYLSATHHIQVACGGGDPRVESMPLLELALRGTRRELAGSPKQVRLPITPGILNKLLQVWNRDPTKWDHVMLWAACCLGFSASYGQGNSRHLRGGV